MPKPTHLDPVNGMDVLHAINHNPSNLLQILVFAHGCDSVSLDEDVAVRQEFDSLEGAGSETVTAKQTPSTTHLECAAIRSDNPLSSLDESILVPDHPTNLDDIARHLVLQHLDRLRHRHTSCQQADHIPGLQDDIRVVRFTCRFDGHATLNEIEDAGDAVGGENSRECWP